MLRSAPGILTGDVAVSRGAELWLTNASAVTPARFDGAVSGEGSLRKSGTGEVVLGGANTFTGGIFVEAGALTGTATSIPGDVTLADAAAPTATIIFDQPIAGIHTGTISGDGTLQKSGAGRLLRQGVTAVTLTRITAGTLAGDVASLGSTIDVQSGAVAEFAVADAQVFGGAISGAGSVTKTGLGELLIATPQAHMGQTTVAQGTLALAAGLNNTSLLRIQPGARLANVSGTVAGDVENAGTLAAGASTTVFDVAGTALLESGSILAVSVDDAQNASLLRVAGAATLNAPGYSLDLVPGDYSTPRLYTVLSASSIAGTPGVIVEDLAFISPVMMPTVVGSTVQLSIQEDFTNLARLATTPNQSATAMALEQLLASPASTDSRAIKDALVPLRETDIPGVFDAIAGETLSGFTNLRTDSARYFADAIFRRLHASPFELDRPGASAGRSVQLASTAPRAQGGLGGWLEPFGIFGDNRGRGRSSDFDTRSYGVSGGVDYRLPERLGFRRSENVRLGVGVGYTGHSLANQTGLMSGSANAMQAALYGGYRGRRFHAGAAARYAWTGMETRRRIAFTSLDRTAKASFDGQEFGGLVEVGGHFGDPKRAVVHPLARFQYVRTTQDAITETGAGDLSLAVPELRYDSLLLTLGGRVSRVFTLDGEFGIEPELRAAWTVDYGDRGRHVPATFYAVPGVLPFTTAGTEPDRNSITAGFGYLMTIADVPLVSTHYDVQFGENHIRHVLSVGLYLRW